MYQYAFLNGVLSLMYMKEDADIINEKKASDYKTLFAKDKDDIKHAETNMDNRLRPNYSFGAFR